MENLKKFFLKQKFKIIIIATIIILLALGTFYGMKVLLPDRGQSIYGSRLEGINEYEIDKNRLSEIKELVLESEIVEKVNTNISGKIVNFVVYVDFEADLEVAKSVSEILLVEFTEEEKGFYDMQLFLTSEEESDIYPKIGYKHSTSVNFVWSN